MYYLVSILGSPLGVLTYSYDHSLNIGTKVQVTLNNRVKNGVITKSCDKPTFKTLPINEVEELFYSQTQLSFASFISTYYFCSLGEALAIFTPFNSSIIEESQEKLYNSTKIVLSETQNSAFDFLQKNKISLLFGDTGSGKTEIYMKYFEKMIESGKNSIFLMPEISLTPQMQIRLEEHFGDSVVMWHSKLTKKLKEKALAKIYSNEATIIAGARSALFLPVKNIGLIVVDEEHDDSYKASSRPRYNARDMAIYMGSKLGIQVVLGSATPSLSSYVKFPHTRLKGGHFSSEREFIYEREVESITPLVESMVTQTHANNSQSMLFIPTRANFKYLICESCGFTYECPYCSVGMSLHKNSSTLKCHYCNYSERVAQICPECHAGKLINTRIGTAEAVKYFKEKYTDIVVDQFDRDVITTQKKLKDLLKRFNENKIDLLIGTQMLSKGHDYHDVSLAIIFGIDNILNMSDYRSREKALSLLIQIAGRSGRKNSSKVLVQSFNEKFFNNYISNYEDFLEDEKSLRAQLYPPFVKLARVLFAHANGAKAQESMREMENSLRACSKVEIVGSGKAAIEKIANKYRFVILIRSKKSTDLLSAIKACKNPLAEVDIDPIEFS